MQKIMFDKHYGLEEAVIEGRKPVTRRAVSDKIMAKAESYQQEYFAATLSALTLEDALLEFSTYKVGELMAGFYAMVDKDGLCIPKGTIVQIRSVDADDKLPEKGLEGSAHCVSVSDRSVSGGIWCAYLAPVPLTRDILEKSGWQEAVLRHWNIEEDFAIEKGEDGNIFWFLCGTALVCTLNYVHELQLALRLRRINKVITI